MPVYLRPVLCDNLAMAWLEVKNLTLKEKDTLFLSELSFSLEKGTITLLAGRNGSGKSMLLKSLKGLLPADGSICLDGKELKRRERLRSIGLVFQETALQIVGSTVEKDVAFGPENLGLKESEIAKIVDAVIAELGLEKVRTKNPSDLSGGERRMLSIAGVIAMSPSIILLDEPLANLDYPATVNVIKTLIKLKDAGFTIIIASHEAEKFLAHTDRTIILRGGRIVSDRKSEDSLDVLKKYGIYIPPKLTFKELSWAE